MVTFDCKFFDKNGDVNKKIAMPSFFDAQVEIEVIATKAKSGKLMNGVSFFQYPNFIDGINISQIQHSWEEYSPLLRIKNRLSLFFI